MASRICAFLTIDTSVIRFYVYLLDLTIVNDQSIAFTAMLAEDGSAVKRQIQRAGEGRMRVCKEADL